MATALRTPMTGLAAGLVLLLGWAAAAPAQVVSQARGQLTFSLGQGSAPVGGIASDVVAGARGPDDTSQHHLGFRIAGGYQFADYVAFEAAILHIGTWTSRAAYLGTDQLVAQTQFDAIEANLVGKVPLAQDWRLDLTLGAAETDLKSALSTVSGSALPTGQSGTVRARRFGVSTGADIEWRLTDHTSVLAGYHAFPGAGSKRVLGAASGTVSLLQLGFHFEF